MPRSIARPSSRIAIPAIPTALYRHIASAAATATVSDASEQPFFPDEPSGPTVKTAIPGPKNLEATDRLSKVFETRSLNMMTNYPKSLGN
jgi:4-aminobutyrate aminotransferase / (S)-3-amino-2-methylpropionate transaminase